MGVFTASHMRAALAWAVRSTRSRHSRTGTLNRKRSVPCCIGADAQTARRRREGTLARGERKDGGHAVLSLTAGTGISCILARRLACQLLWEQATGGYARFAR